MTAAGTLRGRRVIVTRAAEHAAELAAPLEARGAVALVAPAIRLEPAPHEELDRATGRLADGDFDWLVVTSQAGVEALFGRVGFAPSRVRASVAAVGEGTARALRDLGMEPDLVPTTFTTEALGRAMPSGSGRVLLARADIAPEGLEDELRAKGWWPERVDAYRTVLSDSLPPEVRTELEAGRPDAVTFTSASTVRGFLRMAGPPSLRVPVVVCIGPVTAAEAEGAGLRVAGVAEPHTIDGLVSALERVVGPAEPKEIS